MVEGKRAERSVEGGEERRMEAESGGWRMVGNEGGSEVGVTKVDTGSGGWSTAVKGRDGRIRIDIQGGGWMVESGRWAKEEYKN